MDSIRLKSFRSLKDTGPIELKPITFLLGQNSSGKSTFLRSFALLKQSINVRAREPFLWVGELVDFGGISETLSTFSEEKKVTFEYEFTIPNLAALLRGPGLGPPPPRYGDRAAVSISEVVCGNDHEIAFEYIIEIKDSLLEFSLSREGKFCSFKINKTCYVDLVKDRIIAKVWRGPLPTFSHISAGSAFDELDDAEEGKSFSAAVDKFIKARSHGRTGIDKRNNAAWRLKRFPFDLLRVVRYPATGDTVWHKTVSSWTTETPEFIHFKNLILGARFPDIMGVINDYTLGVLENFRYITPLRANAERYYRKQGLAVDELDPKGTNFALFLDNMTQGDRQEFANWCEQFFGVSILVEKEGGHLSLFIIPKDSTDSKVNIADTGFGFSQMFPILAQLWTAQKTKDSRKKTKTTIPLIFAIEQPELHLHPKLQANLADVFISSIHAANEAGIDLRLIVETHSEYLINRVGNLISAERFPSSEASVLIFERESYSEETKIKRASYSREGYLENWPYGFFEPGI
ncbi:AAA family ATPase [Stutzerimonas xanthomarina]|uniref:AAA family ATPase n=1 Tax=Stutzerimonas xanthomarina TaxID=271420 RepID=UPI0029A21D45|nr:AAA family ATPase [Stutzerimonas xanthomarina]MDX2354888.1 AAA family ATPase [Stutzerimonas xanthomarina]